jgi:hypothetical protein
MDLTEFARRVRRRGLLRALAEGSAPSAPSAPPPRPQERPVEPPPPPQPPAEPETQPTVEFELDPVVTERLQGCTVAGSAVITGVADLPAVEAGGRVIEVALLRMQVRRPEGDTECCVRQHVPPEIRGVIAPGAGVMVRAHENDRSVAVVDWTATGNWIGAKLTSPSAPEQYDWPERSEWPARGSIEVHDVDGLRAELDERRGKWSLASADLVSLTPLRSRVDQRDEWQVALQLGDGSTVEIRDRMPLLALARLRPGDTTRVGTPIDVLVSADGEVAVDWEATLRQPELRVPRARSAGQR